MQKNKMIISKEVGDLIPNELLNTKFHSSTFEW